MIQNLLGNTSALKKRELQKKIDGYKNNELKNVDYLQQINYTSKSKFNEIKENNNEEESPITEEKENNIKEEEQKLDTNIKQNKESPAIEPKNLEIKEENEVRNVV